MGHAYFTGDEVKRDNLSALEWWKKAAAQGHSGAREWIVRHFPSAGARLDGGGGQRRHRGRRGPASSASLPKIGRQGGR